MVFLKFLAVLGATNENKYSKSNNFQVTCDSARHEETYIFYLMMMMMTLMKRRTKLA